MAMKKRITIEQLNQLPDDKKQKLRDWWEPQEGDWVLNPHNNEFLIYFDGEYGCYIYGEHLSDYTNLETIKEECLPLLSIGQMIEILQTTDRDWQLWGSDWTRPEICDLLWRAVKDYFFEIYNY